MPDNGWEDCKFVFDFIRTSLWKQSRISTGAERFEDKRTVSNDPSKTQTIYLLHQLHVDCSLYYPLYHISLQGKTTKTWPITLWPYKETQFSLIHYSQVCCAFIACVHEVHIHVKSTHYKTVFASEYALSVCLSPPFHTHTTVVAYIIASDNMCWWVTVCAAILAYIVASNKMCHEHRHILLPMAIYAQRQNMPQQHFRLTLYVCTLYSFTFIYVLINNRKITNTHTHTLTKY